MSLFQAITLGVVQGLGEFLPISSSAHLVLTPWIFGWEDPGLAFDVALHFGTLLAVLFYFRDDWFGIIASGFRNDENSKYPKYFLWLLALGTIPGVLAGFFLEDYAETSLRNPLLIAFTLSLVGFLLYFADKKLSVKSDLKSLSWKNALLIGIAQSVAIVPGVSRSGSTITAALAQGIDRKSAAKFSFLLSTPIIFGATILKAKDFFSSNIGIAEVTGIIAAAISGYMAIAGLIKLVEKADYKAFFWYRLALALIIVIFWVLR